MCPVVVAAAYTLGANSLQKGNPQPAKGGTPVKADAPAKADTAGKGAAPAQGKTGAASGQMSQADMMAMMAKCEEMNKKGPEHAMLAQRAGKWTFVNKCWMAPGTEPMEVTGTSEAKSILDGRYLAEEISGEMMGKPFRGMGMAGFDNIKKKYVSTWVDNMGTGVMVMEGTYDAASKSITYKSEMPNPMTGKYEPSRVVSRMDSPDQSTMEFYGAGPDGKEFKSMEITYKRAK
jgi:hypothetical protein